MSAVLLDDSIRWDECTKESYYPRVSYKYGWTDTVADLSDIKDRVNSQDHALFEERLRAYKDTMLAYVCEVKGAFWGSITYRRRYYEPELDQDIPRPDGAGFLYYDQTVSACRRKGIHRAGISRRLELTKNAGKSKALSLVMAHNPLGIKSYRSFAFVLRARLVSMKIGPFKLRPAARGFNIRP